MELQVYQVDGSGTGRTVALDASVFGVEPNDHVLWLDVRRIQSNARQGTHKAKERGENAHSTRKLYRQKGTGMARAGSAKSPLRRGGGTMFGPRPRTYGLKLTKKTRQLARRSALTYKAREEALRVVESLAFERPSTQRLLELIRNMDLAGQKVLVLTAEPRSNLYQSSRNLAKVAVQEVRNASTLDLLAAQVVVLEEGALDVLSALLGGAASVAASGDGASTAQAPAPAVAAEPVAPAAEEPEAEEAEAVAEPEVEEADATEDDEDEDKAAGA